MRPSQRHRLFTVLFALFSLLFMQLAVASYVCPGDSKAVAVKATAMPCAGEMVVDTEQVALCNAHCQADQQSVEKTQAQTPTADVSIGVTYPIEPIKIDWSVPQGYGPSQLHATAPPMAIRNCCFRI